MTGPTRRPVVAERSTSRQHWPTFLPGGDGVGYPSELYDRALHDWTRHPFDLPNQAAGGRRKRRMTEVVWCNF